MREVGREEGRDVVIIESLAPQQGLELEASDFAGNVTFVPLSGPDREVRVIRQEAELVGPLQPGPPDTPGRLVIPPGDQVFWRAEASFGTSAILFRFRREGDLSFIERVTVAGDFLLDANELELGQPYEGSLRGRWHPIARRILRPLDRMLFSFRPASPGPRHWSWRLSPPSKRSWWRPPSSCESTESVAGQGLPALPCRGCHRDRPGRRGLRRYRFRFYRRDRAMGKEYLSTDRRSRRAGHHSGGNPGTAADERFVQYVLEFGEGASPIEFFPIGEPSEKPVEDNALGLWEAGGLVGEHTCASRRRIVR